MQNLNTDQMSTPQTTAIKTVDSKVQEGLVYTLEVNTIARYQWTGTNQTFGSFVTKGSVKVGDVVYLERGHKRGKAQCVKIETHCLADTNMLLKTRLPYWDMECKETPEKWFQGVVDGHEEFLLANIEVNEKVDVEKANKAVFNDINETRDLHGLPCVRHTQYIDTPIRIDRATRWINHKQFDKWTVDVGGYCIGAWDARLTGRQVVKEVVKHFQRFA